MKVVLGHIERMFRFQGRSSSNSSSSDGMFPPKGVLSGSSGAKDWIDIDNSKSVLFKISTLFTEKLMCDISLIVGGIEYPAHRLILCVSSEVFQVMLMNPEWSESQKTKVELQETPACANVFGEFLYYLYTGHMRINHVDVLPILCLADKYNIKDLVVLCLDYMRKHIPYAAACSQLISWLQYTVACGHYCVAKACLDYVKWNLELIAKCADFGNLEADMLVLFLKQNDLVVHDEMALYNYVVDWLNIQRERLIQENQYNSEYIEQLVTKVMSHIRFPMMTPHQLAELLLFPLTKTYKEFFVERMAIGMSFHSDQAAIVAEIAQEQEGKLLFTPRLYTADKWSTMLSVENFPSLPPYSTRTLFFSSSAALADYAGDRTYEWIVDFSPRGVWFQKFYLIGWQGTVEVPEHVLRTVRLSITCRDPPEKSDVRVKIGILIHGVQDSVEHVITVLEKYHHFSEENKVLNVDEVLPFNELNNLANSACTKQSSQDQMSQAISSNYLVGLHKDIVKVHIVITPLSELCCTDPPPFY